MPNLLDYLAWRGDLTLRQSPFCPVDALLLSTLVYVRFESLVPSHAQQQVTIGQAAQAFLSLPEKEAQQRVRCKSDLELLQAVARAPRFRDLPLVYARQRTQAEEEIQFAAFTVLLGEDEMCLVFRGTDATLVGWKEDFNLSFQPVVPSQQAALVYTAELAAAYPWRKLRLCGHSKGGNLAMYAAVLSSPPVQSRIIQVCNHDGPGFSPAVLKLPGYQTLLPRLSTFVPQSSVVGMLLEHEEPYIVIRSNQHGVFQHDPYSWEVLGNDFVRLEQVTASSQWISRTTKQFLIQLTPEERSALVDGIYSLLSSGEATSVEDLFQPQNLHAILQAVKSTDPGELRRIAGIVGQLIRIAATSDKTLPKP
ncbi:MAG: Mbeg1-like protein [Eubacteriales bacterium]|jgi:hypothetical protein